MAESNVKRAVEQVQRAVIELHNAGRTINSNDPFTAILYAESAKEAVVQVIKRARTEARKLHAKHAIPFAGCYICDAKARREAFAIRRPS